MDTNVMIMFASVLCTMTALCFMELRRIRKKLESKLEASRGTPTQSGTT
jgi:hypothetical protein